MQAKSNKFAKGFRKTATAIAKFHSSEDILINGIALNNYFRDERLASIVMQPVRLGSMQSAQPTEQKGITVKVGGSGSSAQAQAVRHAIAKLYAEEDETIRGQFKKMRFLKGDPRQVERKKPGRYKARKAYVFRRR